MSHCDYAFEPNTRKTAAGKRVPTVWRKHSIYLEVHSTKLNCQQIMRGNYQSDLLFLCSCF